MRSRLDTLPIDGRNRDVKKCHGCKNCTREFEAYVK